MATKAASPKRIPKLWRLHVRPRGGDGDTRFATELCIRKGVIGMGWGVSEGEERSTDFKWYSRTADEVYGPGKWSSVARLVEDMKEGDFVWFRHPEGRYYAAEVNGPWEYCYKGDHIPADVINIRPARIVEVGLADRVPGKIIACFRPQRTLQTIAGQNMLAFTHHLLGLRTDGAGSGDALDYLNDEDLENVVSIYLQTQGWLIIPGTRRFDTPHYEFVLVHGQTGERAIVQVKSGSTWLKAADYDGTVKTFLFAASGAYGDTIPSNVDTIRPDVLRAFIVANQRLMPDAVRSWTKIASASR